MPNYKFRFSKHAISNFNKELTRIQRFQNSKRIFDDFDCIESLPEPPKVDSWNIEKLTIDDLIQWDIDYDEVLQQL